MKRLWAWVLGWFVVLLLGSTAWANTATWQDNSDNEDGFIVQSCPGVCTNSSPTWAEVGKVGSNVTTFSFTAIPNTTYRVLAFNVAGNSGPSNVFTWPSTPGAPTSFTVGP